VWPDASVKALAGIYGFDPGNAHETIGALLRRRYPHPVVGDRLAFGSVEFVIREVDDDRIVKIGLKLRKY
ncbi:MAG: transporter associated domain-containing protein, partial [Pseudomonadota bacterium]